MNFTLKAQLAPAYQFSLPLAQYSWEFNMELSSTLSFLPRMPFLSFVILYTLPILYKSFQNSLLDQSSQQESQGCMEF